MPPTQRARTTPCSSSTIVVGMYAMPKPLYTSGPANAAGYGTPFAERNVLMIGAVSVVSMPRKATSGACSLRYAAFMSGVSARHGGHHVAQKLSTVTLPAVADAASGVPASVVACSGGAAEPTGALGEFGAAPRAAKRG